MGRKKSRPIRSGTGALHISSPDSLKERENLNKNQDSELLNKTIYVEIDRTNWASDEHFDLAEIILSDVRFSEEKIDYDLLEKSFKNSEFSLRFCMEEVKESSFILGHWPVIPSDRISLEFLTNSQSNRIENRAVLFSAKLDGSDESVSSLAHLVNLKFVTLRLLLEIDADLIKVPSFRVRVEILRSAFNACESLLETVRQPWRKSMVNLMSWLRPEILTSEKIYGFESELHEMQLDGNCRADEKSDAQFDFSGFYEAIKPSKEEPMLENEIPDLVPDLRPYQRRAAYWMVQREKKAVPVSPNKLENNLSTPYCVLIDFLNGDSRMFYNPFNGNISWNAEPPSEDVYGGILADEMGLGKTVELLACIFAHPKPHNLSSETLKNEIKIKPKRPKIDRVECICGAASSSSKYKGLWVQCDLCDAWQHAKCVNYKPKIKKINSANKKDENENENCEKLGFKKKKRRKRGDVDVIETEEKFVCSLCDEIMEATQTEISTRATLVVCPAPILAQWHSEIIRHTKEGSLKVCIYEGARNLDLKSGQKIDINELVNSDIVLTTYDVLKEDLSHDSDRHDGDRRFLRFQKKYPVVPTVLTRLHWWRLCLDEAQAVESSSSSITEMAMRLSAVNKWCVTGTPIQRKLDDLFGLLRFLRVGPFDVGRWWGEVVRDPYERGDKAAMKFAHKFFRKIMWRSSKSHVSDELQLPAQEESLTSLSFSPVEEHFYQKQHATCLDRAHDIIKTLRDQSAKRESDSNNNDVYLSHNEIERLMGPLLKLRQACCHPQVGSSGLCSLQSSPLSMDEILEVLIGKAKIEGEEELRKIVVALNGLAGIAIIEQDNDRAIGLYKEALNLADEHYGDFRIDPLLNLHINHNMSELLRNSAEYLPKCPLVVNEDKVSEKRKGGKFDRYYVKRRKKSESKISNKENVEKTDENKIGNEENVEKTDGNKIGNEENVEKTDGTKIGNEENVEKTDGTKIGNEEKVEKTDENKMGNEENMESSKDADVAKCTEIDAEGHRCYSDECMRKTCEKIIQKHLSIFGAKLNATQQEFKTSFEQVSTISKELDKYNANWWLHALNCIEKSKESTDELIRKIEQNFTRSTNGLGSARVSSRIKTLGGLKYTIQTAIDALHESRRNVMERLLELDRTVENPRDEVIERQRFCPNCYDGNGALCFQCEMDDLFRVYEARLFLVKKSHNDAIIASAEEVVDLQKRQEELNHFFRNKKTSDESGHGNHNLRFGRENIQVYRHPSAVETMLRVIKTHSKTALGRQEAASSKKHLQLFEALRKEFSQARTLSTAQAQFLRAHDEIKMSTSRLRLKEREDEQSAINVLERGELVQLSLQFSSDKFLGLPGLGRVKGQLRYLKGMVRCNKKPQAEKGKEVDETGDLADVGTSSVVKEESEKKSEITEEPCPICREKFSDKKMVFQCGHFLCCKCCLLMTEQAVSHLGRSDKKWIMCPTCRQRTDFNDIAYVAEKQINDIDNDSKEADYCQMNDTPESSVTVKGSYGTKMEAVTRRILWLTQANEEAKVLVFSSWNDVLDVLEHSLITNSISYVRMKGGRKAQFAIAKFKGHQQVATTEPKNKSAKRKPKPISTKPVQVLLMLIQHGANGLNLLEAQHVVLVEPLLNPGAEAQAISRVHRVGQDKQTFIHRFMIRSTIEESIYKLNRNRAGISNLNRKSKNLKDEPVLTLKDVESLFPVKIPDGNVETEGGNEGESLRNLPPAVAAGLAAGRRLMESSND